MLARSIPKPVGRICCAHTFCAVGARLQVGRAPADRFDQLGVRQRQHLQLRLQRILVRQIVRRVQQRQRIVDEVELLQAEDRLTVLVEVVALRIGDAVDGLPACATISG